MAERTRGASGSAAPASGGPGPGDRTDDQVLRAFEEGVIARLVDGPMYRENAIQVLVSAAGPAIHANQVVYYALDRHDERLEATAYWPRQHAAPASVQVAADGVVASSARSRAASMRLSGQRTEYAVPVPSSPLCSRSGHASGVLLFIFDQVTLGNYESALARNFALRVALLHAGLRGVADRVAPTPLEVQRPFTVRDGTDAESYVPRDVATVLPSARDVLATLYRDTPSQSVSLRVALPTVATGEPHGLGLVRLAQFPERDDLHQPRFLAQPQEAGGVNWRVVASGQHEYWPDFTIDQPSDFAEHRLGTRSELTVPIQCEGRVIGVLNLESPFPHAYDHHARAAYASAQEIGRRLTEARLLASRRANEKARHIVTVAHQFEADANQFGDALQRFGHSNLVLEFTQFRHRLSGLRRAYNADDSRQEGARGGDEETVELRRVVEEVARERRFLVSAAEGFPSFQLTISAASIFRGCLREVLLNHRAASTPEAGESVDPYPLKSPMAVGTVKLVSIVWGGVRVACLTVTPTGVVPYDDRCLGPLYNEPIQVEGRGLRLGAYSAGRDARMLGGELYAFAAEGALNSRLLIPENPA